MGRLRAAKTRQVAQVAPFHHLALQDDPSAPNLMFSEVKSMVLGLQNTLWRSKHVLEQLYHFGRRKVSAWRGLRRGGRGDNIIGELLAPKCTLEHLGSRAPWPAGCGPGRDRTFPGFLAGQEKYQVFYQVYYHVFSQVPNPRFSWFSMITNAFP